MHHCARRLLSIESCSQILKEREKLKEQQDAANKQLAALKEEKREATEQLALLESKEQGHVISELALREELQELRSREGEWNA